MNFSFVPVYLNKISVPSTHLQIFLNFSCKLVPSSLGYAAGGQFDGQFYRYHHSLWQAARQSTLPATRQKETTRTKHMLQIFIRILNHCYSLQCVLLLRVFPTVFLYF
jgi:hypothetical protein